MRQKIAFCQYNPNKPLHYVFLLKSLMMQDFLIHTNLHPMLQNRRPYYLKSTIDYIKYLATKMEPDQSIIGRTISADRLFTSIESTNWLLDRDIAPVGTCQFVQLDIWKKRRRTFTWHLTPSKQSQEKWKMLLCHRPPDCCMAKQLMMVKKSLK